MSVYDIITERILAKMEQGIIPWRQPWSSMGLPRNYVSKKEYRGINLILLNMAGYASPYWLTFKQVNDCKGKVKRGEQASPVVYFTLLDKDADNDTSDTDKKKEQVPVLRYYSVFNLEQTTLEPEISDKPANPISSCEQIMKEMPSPPRIYFGGSKAYYSHQKDFIKLPAPKQFGTIDGYYEVLFHELSHSTGHEKRLNRPSLIENSGFGTDAYGFEEMTAEFGAAYLCGHTGIDRTTTDSSAGYILSWMQTIRADKKLLIKAASAAQKAVDFILNDKKEND